MTQTQLIKKLEDIVKQAGSLRQAGKWLGVSASHLCRVINGDKRPGPKLLSALKMTEVSRTYEVQRKRS